MTSMTSPTTRVVIGGVDTHGHTHHAAVIDNIGRQLGDREFTATPAGYRALADWLRGYGTLEMIGVEGTGAYGAALARYLRTIGLTVVEVDRPDRKSRRAHAQVRPPRRLRRRQSGAVGVDGRGAEAAGWPRRGDPGAPRRPLQRSQSP